MEDKKRDSNLELMRIVMMIIIISHHYVVNSGIAKLYDFSNLTFNMMFLQCIGFAGKTMINCFILITGYFMIKGKIKLKKIIKLFLQIEFYQVIIYLLFVVFGMEQISIKGIIKTIFGIVYNANIGFIGTFFFLYLLIPFINILLNNIKKGQYNILLGILLFYFTIISTFFMSNSTFNELTWYIVVYMIGAYIRLYIEDKKIQSSESLEAVHTHTHRHINGNNKWKIITLLLVILSISSIIGIDIINNKLGTRFEPYFFVINAHKILAILLAISLFMMFKNMKIKYNKIINTIATTTFGVLLIHANSWTTRNFLWKDLFCVSEQYYSNTLILHSISTIIIVYVVCVCIDLIRIYLIEKPVFKLLEKNKKYNKLCDYVDNLVNM